MKLKDMKQMDDQIQLIQDRIHAIIRRMKKNEPNMSRLREVVAKMICHNRRIRDQIEIVKPFYQGDITAPVPTHEQRIENLLNTKLNGANRYLVEFGEACSAYLPGELPNDVLDTLRDSTISLIVDVLEPLHAAVELNVSVTVVSDMINFLKTSDPRLSRKEYLRKLDKHIERLIRRFCQNSDAFFGRTNELIAARRAARNTTKRKSEEREPRKGSRATSGELTQADVAKDFGVSRQQVSKWEREQTTDGPSNESNPYGYYKALRTEPKLRNAYTMLANQAKMHKKLIEESKKKGKRFKLTFVQFQENMLEHSQK